MIPEPIFGFIHMYGLMIAIGVLCALWVLERYGKKVGVSQKMLDFAYYDMILSIAFGFGSAAVFQALYTYIEHPENGFHIDGSITFLGGLIGGAALFFIAYAIWRKKLLPEKLTSLVQVLPCCITIGHGFGRIGCFCAGCCYGKPTDSFLGVHFPNIPGTVHPTQLYEAFFLFVLFAVLSLMLYRGKGRFNFAVYLMGYGVFRFLIEFIRDDERGELIGALTPSQFWSVLMVVFGLALLVLQLKKKPEAVTEEAEAAADTAVEAVEEAAEAAETSAEETLPRSAEEAVEVTAEAAEEAAD